jgi:AraC-like DNA-binding protein
MSPPQSQKKMRLSETRRLRLTEHIDASQVAFEVGCESPSQFSRDYSRQCGAPPMRHIKRLMQQSIGGGPGAGGHAPEISKPPGGQRICVATASRPLAERF